MVNPDGRVSDKDCSQVCSIKKYKKTNVLGILVNLKSDNTMKVIPLHFTVDQSEDTIRQEL